ncbi:MAG: membrane protein insertase YidC [Gammaproteobacteria bacterium]|nr:membrane protein insertase YidC [Gammaproteobacteria bacterium]
MDIQRIILIFGMAVTSYMLVLAWNEDYHQKSSNGIIEVNEAAPVAVDYEPVIGVLSETVVDELPDIDFQAEIMQREKGASAKRELIKISTDVLNVWVDTRGGDITRVDLPQFPQNLDSPDQPFVLIDPRNSYVAQSGLIGPQGPDAKQGRTIYSAEKYSYSMQDGDDELLVDLSFVDENAVEIIKRFRFQRGNYLIGVEFLIKNNSSESWSANIFAQIKRDGQPPVIEEVNSMGLRPYVGGATYSTEAPYYKLEFDDLGETPFKEKVDGGYIAMVQHYFVSAWVPPTETTYIYQARKVQNKDQYLMGFTGPTITIPSGGSDKLVLSLYAGPKDQYKLREISRGLDLTVDYGFLWWIAQPLFSLLDFIHGLVGNWGLAIILLTVIVKMFLYPLSAASYKSMAKMRKLQPEMQRLKERFGDDKQKFSQAMMDLYKKEGANPLGGCLPMLLQMPVFLALYWTLMESVELRQAPFYLWIEDLSVMDPYFVLPILMGGSMFLTQMMQPEPPDPVQARVMKLMPVMFTFFFLWFPSGLVLYWLVNNIISVLQQWYVTRKIANAPN